MIERMWFVDVAGPQLSYPVHCARHQARLGGIVHCARSRTQAGCGILATTNRAWLGGIWLNHQPRAGLLARTLPATPCSYVARAPRRCCPIECHVGHEVEVGHQYPSNVTRTRTPRHKLRGQLVLGPIGRTIGRKNKRKEERKKERKNRK